MDYKTSAQPEYTPFMDFSDKKERADSVSPEQVTFDSPVAIL
jgi:hypothetical protein